MQSSCKPDLIAFFPLLQSDRLMLRKVQQEDQDELYRLLNDPKVRKYNSFRSETARFPQRISRYFDDSYYSLSSLHFAVVLKKDRRFAGLCSFQRWNESEGSASLGYMIFPELWNQGIASESAALLLRFGFDKMGLKLVYAACDPENLSSQRVLEKCGFLPAESSPECKGIPEIQHPLHKRFILTSDIRNKDSERYSLLHK